MSATVAVEVCLAIAVVVTWLCCVAILIMPSFYERLHYLATVTTISAFSILIAVLIAEGWGQAAVKAIFVSLVLVLINAVVTHATARAARVRSLGHWSSDPFEQAADTRGRGGAESELRRQENE